MQVARADSGGMSVQSPGQEPIEDGEGQHFILHEMDDVQGAMRLTRVSLNLE